MEYTVCADYLRKRTLARDQFASKTTFAASSTGVCLCKLMKAIFAKALAVAVVMLG
jgi:hypothetical protein